MRAARSPALRLAGWLLVATTASGEEAKCTGLLSKNGRACCPQSCGACGAPTCASDPGGAGQCCTDHVLKGSECSESRGPPCKIPLPNPTTPAKVPCHSGLENDIGHESCGDFCKEVRNCAKCKCKACAMCISPPPVISPPPTPSPLPPAPPDLGHFTTEPDPMGCSFSYVVDTSYARGFKAEVLLHDTKWKDNMRVLVDFGPVAVDIGGSWGASSQRIKNMNAYLFFLRRWPDERGGFGFNARADAEKGAPMPTVQCVGAPPPPLPPLPPGPPPPPRPPPPPSPAPSPPPEPPPPISIYAPKKIEHVVVEATSCASVELKWHSAEAVRGHPVLDYQLSAQRADGSAQPIVKGGVIGHEGELGGLISGTKYAVTVRGRSAAGGFGPKSTALILDTDPATRPPEMPFDTPKVLPSGTSECAAIALSLPALRGGCGGDESFTVEVSGDSGWRAVLTESTATTAVIDSLDPYAAHRFRLVAVNSAGRSASGRPTPATLTDPAHSNIVAPPSVKAISSASFEVSWRTSACRPQLNWEVLVAKHAGYGEEQEWKTIANGVGGSKYEAQMRCPEGCAFKVKPLELRGWDQYSQPSAESKSLELPPIPDGGTRVELKLVAEATQYEPAPFANELTADLASALAVAENRVLVIEVRGRGQYCIVDLLASGSSGPGAVNAGPGAMELARKLHSLVGQAGSALYAGALTKAIDAEAGVLLIAGDGTATSFGASTLTLGGLAATITATVAGAAAIIACVVMVAKALQTQRGASVVVSVDEAVDGKKRKSKKRYSRVGGTDDYDDYDDSDALIERERQRLNRL